MGYVMSKRMYQEYTTSTKNYKGLSHNELISHINCTFGLRGTVTHLIID